VPGPRQSGLRLLFLGGAGAAIGALLAAFFLLYLHIPAGWSPITGYAPRIGEVFLRAFPYPTVSVEPMAFRIASLALLLPAWGAYVAIAFVLTRTRDPGERRRAFLVVATTCVAAHVALALVPPVFSTDLYRYGLFGRMTTVYGLNPYTTPAHALASDPLWPYAGWRHLRSHYGGTFLWVASAAAALGGGGPVGTALAFKAVMALFNLIACWAVWRLARETGGGDGLEAFALYALNPLVLAESAGSAHPDAIMMAFLLLGAWLWWRGRTTAGFALLVVSAAVKYMTGLFAILAAIHTVFAAERGRRLAVAGKLLLVSAAVLLVIYAPFLRGGAVFSTAVEVILRGRSLAEELQSAPADPPVVPLALFALLFLGALVIASRGQRTHVFELTAVLVTFFVLFALRWRMPWYFITGCTLALVASPTPTNRALRVVTLFLAFLAMLLYCAVVPLGSA
jgi:hypothetical protein